MVDITVDEKVLADIGRGFSIPARPDLLIQLQDFMTQDEPKLDDLANIVSQDIAASATILKTVNSPLYGLARSIADIKQSVRYIGLNGIYNLITGCLLKQNLSPDNASIDLESFWHNATLVANTMVFLSKQIKALISPEKLFTIGLFHDCGIPVMALKYQNFQSTLDFADKNPSHPLTKIEEKLYQVNHATIGYYVASSWRLPKDICQIILQHHDRLLLQQRDHNEFHLAFSLLKMAENMVSEFKQFRESADWPYVQHDVFNLLDISEHEYQQFNDDLIELLAQI